MGMVEEAFGKMKKYIILTLISILYALLLSLVANTDLMNDSGQYYKYAQNLVQTGVYGLEPGVPDAHREPGYGVFLSLIMKLFGDSFFAIVFVQGLLFFWSTLFFSFKTFLTGNLSKIYFLISIFSPTLAGTTTVIYSEILSIILLHLFLGFLWLSSKPQRSFTEGMLIAMFSGLFFAALVLTKSYLQYASLIFILFSVLQFYKKQKVLAVNILVVSIFGILAQGIWNARNQSQLGKNYSQFRVPNALVGRVERLNRFEFPGDIPISLVAAVGSNLCYKIYTEQRCLKFEIRGADYFGAEVIQKYYSKYPESKSQAEKQVVADYLPQYFGAPLRQLYGSFLETLRMSFFEATQKSSKYSFLNTMGSAWHFGGSLILLFLFIKGLRQKKSSFDWFLVLIIFYHWAVMAQMTNLVRYVFTIIPIIYVFSARGLLATAKAPPAKSHIKKQL